MKYKKKPRKNCSIKSKPFSIKLDKVNYAYAKSTGNISKFLNTLVHRHRIKEIEEESALAQWRDVLYK